MLNVSAAAASGRPNRWYISFNAARCSVETDIPPVQKSRLGAGEDASRGTMDYPGRLIEAASISQCVCMYQSSPGRCRLMTRYGIVSLDGIGLVTTDITRSYLPTPPLIHAQNCASVTTATFPIRTQGLRVLRVRVQTLYCVEKNYGPAKGGASPLGFPIREGDG